MLAIMALLDDQISALKLYNEKSNELLELSFLKTITNPKAGVTISGHLKDSGEYEINSEIRGPSKEAIQAFVLTFRYFIQNNESISFKNISELYNVANIDAELKKQFESARIELNNMLDSSNFMNLKYNNEILSNRKIMDVFIYGALAHANPQKYRLYNEWMSFPPAAVLFQNCFNLILGHTLEAIVFVSRLNEKAIVQLERQH